jgi:hypothetical protein
MAEPKSDVVKEETAGKVDGSRRGSLRDTVYTDEQVRRASVAAMTENLTGE